jgi:hypothetical protein
MTSQHEGAGSVNPAANPASSTSGAGTYLETIPNASVRAASIHNAELGDENDAENISYRVYGIPGYDLGWEDNMEKKGLVHTVLSMDPLEVDNSLAELENQRKFSTKTFTECLRGRLGAEFGSKEDSVRVLYT